MNISRRFILPPEAESILSRMAGNRKRRKTYVDTLAADMREGRWVDTHEPIAMSVDGNLIDGQHRLAAVVLSGVGQWFWVAVYDTHQTAIGLPIDRGVQRNNADLLGLDLRVARIANAIHCYGWPWRHHSFADDYQPGWSQRLCVFPRTSGACAERACSNF